MSLPEADVAYLKERGFDYEVTSEANMTCVLLRGFQLPAGYAQRQADLLLRLSPLHPDVPPDMWWFDPPVQRADGRGIPATDSRETHLGRTWQRWSRHFNSGQWHTGVDTLGSFITLIRRELERCALESA